MDYIVLDPQDNVAVALRDIEAGETIGPEPDRIRVYTRIPQGHKVALRPISIHGSILKYGLPVGLAKSSIDPGQHVHIHNVTSAYINNDQNHHE